MTKQCFCCKQEKPTSEFFSAKRNRDGLGSWCKSCCADKRKTEDYRAKARIRRQRWVEKNPEKARASWERWRTKQTPEEWREYHSQWRRDNPDRVRAHWLKAKHGITPEQWDEILIAQSGLCAICSTQMLGAREPHVDHDHGCCPGKRGCGECIRGMLCFRCNVMLTEATTPEVLRAAAVYLEQLTT